jgi:argininosuccinate lyase
MQRWEPEADLAYAVGVMMNHLSTLAQTFILLSTREFGLVRLDDRHCSGSSIMPQKRNPDSLEVIKAKAAFAQGILTSLLSVGKGLFMGYNRETQWTKYWIMDLVDESRPALSIMTDVVKRIRVNKAEMLEQARKDFLGATALMEWMTASFNLSLREVKTVVEKAVRYSEMEGLEEVSHDSLKRALQEMRIEVSVRKKDVENVQRPEGWLARAQSIGMPSEKRVQEGIASLNRRLGGARKVLTTRKRGIEKAKELLSKMERALGR